jgi:hypothetical protein
MVREGNRVYITYNSQGDASRGALQIVDISHPDKPKLISETKTPAWDLNAVRIRGKYAYTVGAHAQHLAYMWVFDVSKPQSPQVVGEISLPSFAATSIELKQFMALVTTGDRSGGIAIVDLRTPHAPRLLKFIDDPDARYVGGGIKLAPDEQPSGLWCRIYKFNQARQHIPRCSYQPNTPPCSDPTQCPDDFDDPDDNENWTDSKPLHLDNTPHHKEIALADLQFNRAKDPFNIGQAGAFALLCRGFMRIEQGGDHLFNFQHNRGAFLRFSLNNQNIPLRLSTQGNDDIADATVEMPPGYYLAKFLYAQNDNSTPITLKWQHSLPNVNQARAACSQSCYNKLPNKASLLTVLSGNPGRLSVFSLVSGDLIRQIPIPGVTQGITAPTRFDTDGKIIYINTNELGLHILDAQTFLKIGEFQYPSHAKGKGNDIHHIGTHKLALVANGERGIGVVDLTDLNAIELLEQWDQEIDLGSANRVRLFGGGCSVNQPRPNISSSHPLFDQPHIACGKTIGFLADGLAGLKIFDLSIKKQ